LKKKLNVQTANAQKSNSSDQITPQYRHIKELASLKYEAEEKREQNLLQQASQMQTVFAFMTAALFMATAICIQYRGALSLKFFLVSISTITFFLLASLICASISQWRWKTGAFADIPKIKESILNNPEWEKTLVEYNRINQWIDLMATIQGEKARLNKRRVGLIIASMICFYCAVLTIIISFIIGIITLL